VWNCLRCLECNICRDISCALFRIGYAGCFMKNADLPAMPFTEEPYPIDAINTNYGAVATGLTKREYFAGLAMQSLAAESGRYGSSGDMAYDAVKLADALLAELERTK
jgi:hypothetical protein